MLILTPPQFSNDFKPAIGDARACKQWLSELPLTHVVASHAEICAQLDLLNQFGMPALERLKVLEQLREPVAYLQGEMAKKYSGKLLPLESTELTVWKNALALWRALSTGYLHCLQACLDSDAEIAQHTALITQRCLRFTALQILEHYDAYMQIDAGLWRQLHDFFALAEERQFAGQTVKDSLNMQRETSSCTAVYVQALLVFLANPNQMTARQRRFLDRWLDKWAAAAPLVLTAPAAAEPVLPLVGVDLEGASGAALVKPGQVFQNIRYIDTGELAIALRKRIKYLRKGGVPAELDVGEDCAPGCERFLSSLYKHWCESVPERVYQRRAGVEEAQVAFGMAAIHFFSSGEKPFRKPKGENLSWKEVQDLQIFGRISSQTEKQQILQMGFSLETWQILDESALGFRLSRHVGQGTRFAHNQLLAVRPSDARQCALSMVKWLMFSVDGGLQIGVRVFPGIPVAIAAGPAGAANAPDKYTQAFLLPEMPALREAASLIVPGGWFQSGKRLEIEHDETFLVTLGTLLDRGSDFDRVTFVRV